ncbi:MAG: hypothetical protein QGH74_06955 [Candidatus Brocadiia bacterium]|nr:hypothetical protein [Candidatus Brocadiia bacterium]
MRRKTRRTDIDSALDRSAMLKERLRLIKKRHRELILSPRDSLMDQYAEGEGFFDDLDDVEDMQLMESIELAE